MPSTDLHKTIKTPSIYSLKKVSGSDDTQSQIRTINFKLSTKGKDNKTKKQRLQLLESTSNTVEPFFDLYHAHLQHLYDFAKEIKINQNITFKNEGKDMQDRYKHYLEKKSITIPNLESSQFEIIGEKVKETISSIEKNGFIVDLITYLQKEIIINNRGEGVFKTEENKAKSKKDITNIINNTIFSVYDIKNLDLATIFTGLQYESVLKAYRLKEVLKTAKLFDINGDLYNTKASLISLLTEFNEAVKQNLDSPYIDALKNIESLTESQSLVHSFVYSFYFSFDAKIREIEEIYFPEINTLYNTLLQELPFNLIHDYNTRAWYSVLYEYKCINLMHKKSTVKDIVATLDTIYDTVFTLLEKIKETHDESQVSELKTHLEELFDKNSENFYQKRKTINKSLFSIKPHPQSFTHPKSAPSFPGSKKKNSVWINSYSLSSQFETWKKTISPLRFLDYILHRLIHKISVSEPYKIYSLFMSELDSIHDTLTISPYDILTLFLNDTQFEQNQDKNCTLYINQMNIQTYLEKPEGERKIKFIQKNVSSKKHKKDRVFVVYSFINKSHNYIQKPIQFETTPGTRFEQNTLSKYLSRELDTLLYSKEVESEFTLLKNCIKGISQNCINEYQDCISSNNKLSKQTEKRIEELKKYPQLTSYNIKNTILDSFYNTIEKLEHTLHLYNEFEIQSYLNHNPIALKLYSSCAVLMSNSINTTIGDHKQLTDSLNLRKYMIQKLSLISGQSVSCKMNRMTHRTSGDSTLVFPYNTKTNTVDYSLGYILATPIKKKEGQKVQFFDSVQKAQKILQKDIHSSKPEFKPNIFVGFFNGSKELKVEKKVHYVFDEKGNKVSSGKKPKNQKETLDLENKDVTLLQNGEIPKYYRTYSNWTLSQFGVSYIDAMRGNNESIGGTAPAGYPKLYYILLPKNCQSLYFPVHISTYYLKKYTPYLEIQSYIKKEENAIESMENALDFLKFRTSLRKKSTISSIEIVLQKTYNELLKKQLYTASAHMQFGVNYKTTLELNPIKNEIEEKKYYSYPEFKEKFQYVIGVDLGEKHLATISIIPISNGHAKPYKTYLPLVNDTSKGVSFAQFVDCVIHQKPIEINPVHDTAYMRHDLIKIQYKNAQKQLGTIPLQLRNKKKHFTDYIVESISTQLVKLAHQIKGYIVFENLDKTLSSRKLERTVMNEIQTQTAKKLGECGLLLNSDYINGDISRLTRGFYIDKDTGNKTYTLSGMSLINPFITSQRCSCCSFTPFYFKETIPHYLTPIRDEKEWKHTWEKDGKIKIRLSDEVSYITIEERTTHSDKVLDITIYNSNGNILQLPSHILDRKVYAKKQYNIISKSVKELLYESLYKKDNKTRYCKAMFKQHVVKQLLYTRPKRDTFECPLCKHSDDADYNASCNIAQLFLLPI